MPPEEHQHEPVETTMHHPHEHARPRLLIGVAAVAVIAVGGLVWARYGEDIQEACFGENGACEVDLGDDAAFDDTPLFDDAGTAMDSEDSNAMVRGDDTDSMTEDGTPAPTPVPETRTGMLVGAATIGPICPVVREGETCTTPPEVYTARSLAVRTLEMPETTMLFEVPIQEDGTFSLPLAPGTYVVSLVPLGMDRTSDLPQEVVIHSGATTTLSVDIDTGIR